jgi:hypothetical protein
MKLVGKNGDIIEVDDAHGQMLLNRQKDWKLAPIEKPAKKKVGRPRKPQGDSN